MIGEVPLFPFSQTLMNSCYFHNEELEGKKSKAEHEACGVWGELGKF